MLTNELNPVSYGVQYWTDYSKKIVSIRIDILFLFNKKQNESVINLSFLLICYRLSILKNSLFLDMLTEHVLHPFFTNEKTTRQSHLKNIQFNFQATVSMIIYTSRFL